MVIVRPPDKSEYLKIIFLISQPKHMLWVLKRTVSMKRFFGVPKTNVKIVGKEINTILGAQPILIWTYELSYHSPCQPLIHISPRAPV